MTLKEIYDLPYDTGEFQSSLTIWYNRLLEKTYDDLDPLDVYRMLNQDILKEVATLKAVDMIIENPYAGYFYDGEFVVKLSTMAITVSSSSMRRLLKTLQGIQYSYDRYDWSDEESKMRYSLALNKLLVNNGY